MIIAVDFDGTIVSDKYPDIGILNKELVRYLIMRQENGDKLILWTCRTGNLLKQAVRHCELAGLKFDAINENLKEVIKHYGGDTRKVFADLYIDDKSTNPNI
jgi:hydroxymethylpyrimidine pyrophosphatase-like HAD family hydrolase